MKNRAILNGIAALSLVGAFYTFAFCMVDEIDSPVISEEYRYSTDTVPVETQKEEIRLSGEKPEAPNDSERAAVQQNVGQDVSYKAVYTTEPVSDLLITPLVTEAAPEVTSVPLTAENEPATEIAAAVIEEAAAQDNSGSNTPVPDEPFVSEYIDFDAYPEDVDAQAVNVISAGQKAEEETEGYASAVNADIINAGFDVFTEQTSQTYVPDLSVDAGDIIDIDPFTTAYTFAPPEIYDFPDIAETSPFSPEYTVYYDTTTIADVTTAADTASDTAADITSVENGVEMLTARYDGSVHETDAYTLVCMIVQNEMSPYFSKEALKAQAVAAYSYVKYHNVNGLVPSVLVKYDISPEIKAAVDEVFGKCCYYNGEVAQTVYTASSAGRSADAQNVWGGYEPYLVSVDTSFDIANDPNYGVQTTFTSDYIKSALESKLGITLSDNPENWFTITERTDGMYVSGLSIDGQTVISGRKLRENILGYSIKSWAFDVSYANGIFTFTTYGYGHGVGMSQNGAYYLARQGYTYDEILKYYFTGITIE